MASPRLRTFDADPGSYRVLEENVRALPITQRLLLSHEGEEPFEEVAATLLEQGLALAGSNGDQLYLFVRT